MTVRARLVVLLACVAVVAGIVRATTARPEAQATAGSAAQLRQLAYLKASNTEGSDHFACGGSLPAHIGNALALSGDGTTVAVGAPHESSAARGINGNQDDNSAYNSGAVYIYVRRGETWTQQAYVKASNAGRSDMFGLSLALSRDGNTLAVAAPWEASAATGVDGNQHDDSIPQAGAVYVFTRAGNTWSQHAYLKASNPDLEDWFAVRLALNGDGNRLLVGSPMEDGASRGVNGRLADNSADDAGAAYLFTRNGTTWSQHAYVKASNAEAYDEFGSSVAVSGDGRTMAVGARMESSAAKSVNGNQADNEAAQSGAAYVFGQ